MESVTEVTSVEREIAIAARPETVWEFLVDAEKVTRWMGFEATLEPQPGGVYLLKVIDGHTARGSSSRSIGPGRLVFRFGWDPERTGRVPCRPGRRRSRSSSKLRRTATARSCASHTTSRRSRRPLSTHTAGITISRGWRSLRAAATLASTRG